LGSLPRRSDGAACPAVTGAFSRAATVEDLKALVRALNVCGAEYLLIAPWISKACSRRSKLRGRRMRRTEPCSNGRSWS
jgi:hypothetical protein